MKSKQAFSAQTLTLILVLVVAFYLWSQYQEVKRLRQANNQQSQSILNLQMAMYQSSHTFNQQTELVHELVRRVPHTDRDIVLVIDKLDKLAGLYAPLFPKVAMEIDSAGKFLRANEPVHAVATMAKILENVLKILFAKDQEFHMRFAKQKSINFGNLITYASEKGICTPQEISFFKELKDIRNESVHELAVRKGKGCLYSCQEMYVDFMNRIIPRLPAI